VQRIQQILLNLLANALKYTSKGYVKIKCYPQYNQGEWFLKIAVRDTGEGISKKKKKKLF